MRLFYDKDATSQILVTFGIALIVEESLRLIFGGTTQQYPMPLGSAGSLSLGVFAVSGVPPALALGIIVMVVGWSGSSSSAPTTA